LAKKTLARGFERINKYIWYTTITRRDDPAVFGNQVDENVSILNVLFDIDSQRITQHRVNEKFGDIVGG
jgi:hypothetical protein